MTLQRETTSDDFDATPIKIHILYQHQSLDNLS